MLQHNRDTLAAILMLQVMEYHGEETMSQELRKETVTEVVAEVQDICDKGRLGLVIREFEVGL